MEDRFDRKYNSWLNEIYLINKGVRSCASDTVRICEDDSSEEVLNNLEQMTIRDNLHFIAFKMKPCSDDPPEVEYWMIYACKYAHQIPIIKFLEAYQGPKYIYDYIMGKLLGYSDAAMEEFLSKNLFEEIKIDMPQDTGHYHLKPVKKDSKENDKPIDISDRGFSRPAP